MSWIESMGNTRLESTFYFHKQFSVVHPHIISIKLQLQPWLRSRTVWLTMSVSTRCSGPQPWGNFQWFSNWNDAGQGCPACYQDYKCGRWWTECSCVFWLGVGRWCLLSCLGSFVWSLDHWILGQILLGCRQVTSGWERSMKKPICLWRLLMLLFKEGRVEYLMVRPLVKFCSGSWFLMMMMKLIIDQ